MVSMDWFEVRVRSPAEEGDKEAAEGFTQCLVTDSQTGYVAAIPSRSSSIYLCEMLVRFL